MPQTIKYLLDEHIDHAVLKGLLARGIDVISVADQKQGMSDIDLLQLCIEEGRVVFTKDSDFLQLHSSFPEHQGIVFASSRRYSIGNSIRVLLQIWEYLDPLDMQGRVEYI